MVLNVLILYFTHRTGVIPFKILWEVNTVVVYPRPTVLKAALGPLDSLRFDFTNPAHNIAYGTVFTVSAFASFEKPVRYVPSKVGYILLLWSYAAGKNLLCKLKYIYEKKL